MSDIYQLVSVGMIEGRQRLEAISLNAASAALPGYKRHVMSARGFDSALAIQSAADAASEPSTLAARPRVSGVDLRAGATISTGRALDISIEQADLFLALTDGTQTWLTRSGSLSLNEEGVLVGEGGLRVVGRDGDVRLPSIDVAVGTDGSISHQGEVVAALQLFQPGDAATLRASRGTLLEAASGIQPAESGTWTVRAGTLEASNTDSAREMLDLMSLSRQFESLSRVVQGYDEALGRAIEKLGEV